jgi:transmembrane sensor
MSAATENASSHGSAAQIRSQAAAWLLRRNDSRDWTEADQAGLEAWLAEATAHEVAYVRLEEAWSRADRLAALRCSKKPGMTSSVRRRKPLQLALGAMVGLGIAASIYIWNVGNSDTSLTVATPVGGRKVVSLADGSQIELNTNSVLRIGTGDEQRSAWLEKGEAFFQIKHDAAHPFSVVAEGHRITDLGTKFRIKDEGGPLEVALVEGSARIDPTAPGRSGKVLLPGDVAIATRTAISISRKTNQELANELGWRRGVLVFKYATLAAVVKEFNRYSERKLVIADPKLAELTIVGTFRTNDFRSFTDLAKEVFGIRVETRGDETVISR